MSISEFTLINKYFTKSSNKRKDVVLGIGDDCALLNVPEGQQLAVTVDTLVENVHFLASVKAEDLAWKSIAVNLSDLAAMGAEPAWLTLALTLPEVNEKWLRAFSAGFLECAAYYGVELVGGDTTEGPLSISIQAMGFTPVGSALTRSGAKPGDLVYVTGNIGDAGLGLVIAKDMDNKHMASALNKKVLLQRLNKPTPRVAEGMALRKIASAVIDLSDGLAGDLQHILDASSVGALIDLDRLPLSNELKVECTIEEATHFALTSGDDYELCFSLAEQDLDKLDIAFQSCNCQYTQIGRITGGNELKFCRGAIPIDLAVSGFNHFSSK